MIIKNNGLGGFYVQNEVEFVGSEINYKFMTNAQLDQEIARGANLYNLLYPPTETLVQGFMKVIVVAIMIVGTVGIAGAAILASYGIGLGTAMGNISAALTTTFGEGTLMAEVQGAAEVISGAGMVYSKVTGDTPEGLMKAADMIGSDNALDVMEKISVDQLRKEGAIIQKDDKASNDALRERLRREQSELREKLILESNRKAAELGRPPVKQKTAINKTDALMLATPFILYALGNN